MMDAIAANYALALLGPLKGGKDGISAHETISDLVDLLKAKQAEVDEANAKSQMCRDEKTHAINRWSQIRKEVEEKDKRIEALIAQIEMSDFKDSLGHKLKSNLAYLDLKALRGEHEA